MTRIANFGPMSTFCWHPSNLCIKISKSDEKTSVCALSVNLFAVFEEEKIDSPHTFPMNDALLSVRFLDANPLNSNQQANHPRVLSFHPCSIPKSPPNHSKNLFSLSLLTKSLTNPSSLTTSSSRFCGKKKQKTKGLITLRATIASVSDSLLSTLKGQGRRRSNLTAQVARFRSDSTSAHSSHVCSITPRTGFEYTSTEEKKTVRWLSVILVIDKFIIRKINRIAVIEVYGKDR